eukprot:1157360-Pelagomonas_calceolata.AAC.1
MALNNDDEYGLEPMGVYSSTLQEPSISGNRGNYELLQVVALRDKCKATKGVCLARRRSKNVDTDCLVQTPTAVNLHACKTPSSNSTGDTQPASWHLALVCLSYSGGNGASMGTCCQGDGASMNALLQEGMELSLISGKGCGSHCTACACLISKSISCIDG